MLMVQNINKIKTLGIFGLLNENANVHNVCSVLHVYLIRFVVVLWLVIKIKLCMLYVVFFLSLKSEGEEKRICTYFSVRKRNVRHFGA